MSGNKNFKVDELGGRHVVWRYVSGKGLYGAEDRIAAYGNGVLAATPLVGSHLFIIGDNGIQTSEIVELKENGELLTVTTKNSVYEVKLRPEPKTSKFDTKGDSNV
jgi:hypothetical protein